MRSDAVAVGLSEFDAMRLERDARSAGEVFGFEDVEGEIPANATTSLTIWWLTGAAAFAGLIGYSFL